MTVARMKVEPCPKCKSMKPLGARYHAPLLLTVDGLKCKHGAPYWSDCRDRIPPPCCWNDYKAAPTGATPRDEAQARLAAFEARMSDPHARKTGA